VAALVEQVGAASVGRGDASYAVEASFPIYDNKVRNEESRQNAAINWIA
jgi:hypothetical protein